MDRELAGRKAHDFFEHLWREGGGPWDFDSSSYEKERLERLFATLEGRDYHRALEIGCRTGSFTRLLSQTARQIVALDISPTAIEQARALVHGPGTVDFRVANVMEYDLGSKGPWDLVVMSESIYYLGWLYPFFDVAWLAARIFEAIGDGGRLLLANTLGESRDYLLPPGSCAPTAIFS